MSLRQAQGRDAVSKKRGEVEARWVESKSKVEGAHTQSDSKAYSFNKTAIASPLKPDLLYHGSWDIVFFIPIYHATTAVVAELCTAC